MAAKPVSADLVGETFEPVPVQWQDADAQLYAVAVGCQPDSELDYLYENRGPKVLPTFCVIPSLKIMASAISGVQINLAMLLHGEQSIDVRRPLPASFSGHGQARISEVWDKGKAAVIGVTCDVSDEQGTLFSTHATLFIRGAGGFGGERGPSGEDTQVRIPDREPDQVIEDQTRPEQAALYRLTGDRNPIHIDPQFARFGGFQRPFLHGLCTYGFAGRAVLGALCDGDASRFAGLSARFSDQLYPGEAIRTQIWQTGDYEAVLQARAADGRVVLSNGRARWRPQ